MAMVVATSMVPDSREVDKVNVTKPSKRPDTTLCSYQQKTEIGKVMDREHSLKTLLKNGTPTITAHNQNLRLAGRLLRPVARTHPVSEMKNVDKFTSWIYVYYVSQWKIQIFQIKSYLLATGSMLPLAGQQSSKVVPDGKCPLIYSRATT